MLLTKLTKDRFYGITYNISLFSSSLFLFYCCRFLFASFCSLSELHQQRNDCMNLLTQVCFDCCSGQTYKSLRQRSVSRVLISGVSKVNYQGKEMETMWSAALSLNRSRIFLSGNENDCNGILCAYINLKVIIDKFEILIGLFLTHQNYNPVIIHNVLF